MEDNKKLLGYYDKPMTVKLPMWDRVASVFMKNYFREEVAASFNYKGEACLDIACGSGELLNQYLSKRYRRLVGVDVSIKEITKARKNAGKNTKFIRSDLNTFLESLGTGKEKFDDIYMLAILEHVSWPTEIVRKVSKILKKEGRVIVEVPNVAWLPHRLSLLLGKFPETAPTVGSIPGVHDEHIRFYSLETLDALFSFAGFRREKLNCSGRLRKLKSLWPRLLASDFVAVYKK